jgi:cyanophycinase-like exopeptidase
MAHRKPTSRTVRTTASVAGIVCGLALLAPATSALAADPHRGATGASDGATYLAPIGGGYEQVTLEGFSRLVASGAGGDTVDILVVPSSYGDAPEDRADNLELAQQRTDQVEAACTTVITGSAFSACHATLLPLLDRKDALDPANSSAFNDAETDGAFILGGDQDLAMRVLANSPAERAMEGGHARGVVFSGTSAGDAVESRTMIAGYTEPGYPWNALERDKVLIAWGDRLDTDERGLSFGSQRIIFGQHFYQRGRFGRLLNVTAQSAERYGHGGKLGVGVDYGTGVVSRSDETLADPFGLSSAAIFDFRTTGVQPRWVGPRDTLSTRNVLTHVLAPGTGMTYDVQSRLPFVDGRPVAAPAHPEALPRLHARGRATLLLGGGDNADGSSPVLQRLVAEAEEGVRGRKGELVVICAGYPSAADARQAAEPYVDALRTAGWSGSDRGVRVFSAGSDELSPRSVRSAAGVLFVGGDQSLMAPFLRDASFVATVHHAAKSSPVVMTDEAMTAAMGDWYLQNADPTDDTVEDAAIASFRAENAVVGRGLGIVRGVSLEPRLTEDYRWGRLYGASRAHQGSVALGVSEQTALEVDHQGARVLGERSVVSVDGRQATYLLGSKGTFGAVNALLSTYGPGDRLR